MEELVPILRHFIEEGTPKQAKQAVRCLHRNLLPEKHEIFEDILKVSIHFLKHINFIIISIMYICFISDTENEFGTE